MKKVDEHIAGSILAVIENSVTDVRGRLMRKKCVPNLRQGRLGVQVILKALRYQVGEQFFRPVERGNARLQPRKLVINAPDSLEEVFTQKEEGTHVLQ